MAVETIELTVEITNVYDGTEIKSTRTVRVPPPAAIEHLRLAEWAEEHLFPLTGTGRTKGDAGYFVKVLESDVPGLVGEEFEWGI